MVQLVRSRHGWDECCRRVLCGVLLCTLCIQACVLSSRGVVIGPLYLIRTYTDSALLRLKSGLKGDLYPYALRNDIKKSFVWACRSLFGKGQLLFCFFFDSRLSLTTKMQLIKGTWCGFCSRRLFLHYAWQRAASVSFYLFLASGK